jgi:hypothetical protein
LARSLLSRKGNARHEVTPGNRERKRHVGQTLREVAKQVARLLIIELFVPGGTLVVLSILLAGRVPAISDRVIALYPHQGANTRPRLRDDLVAHYGLRRFR